MQVIHIEGLSITCAESLSVVVPPNLARGSGRTTKRPDAKSQDRGGMANVPQPQHFVPTTVSQSDDSSNSSVPPFSSIDGCQLGGKNEVDRREEPMPMIEWLHAAVGGYHRQQVREGYQMISLPNSVIELSRSYFTVDSSGVRSASHAPHYTVALRLTTLDICSSPHQLGFLVAAATYMGSHSQYELWRRFRPQCSRPVDGESARRWWQAAGSAVRDEILRRRPHFDWSMLQVC